MSADLVSVIIPAYGHAHFIENTIRSVIQQTYNDIELIVINDGSPDNTTEVVEELRDECEARFKRFIFINKANEGVVKTMNLGLFEAKGRYIASCASDDSFEPQMIERMHAFLSQHPEYGVAVCDNYFMDDHGVRCGWDKNKKTAYTAQNQKYSTFASYLRIRRPDVDFLSDDFGSYKSLLLGNYIPNGYMIRRSVLVEQAGGYNADARLEDYALMLKLAKLTKLKFIDVPLFNYRWHANNTIKNKKQFNGDKGILIAQEEEYALKHGFEDQLYNLKTLGIPHVLTVEKRSKSQGKEKAVKLFGKVIYQTIKPWK